MEYGLRRDSPLHLLGSDTAEFGTTLLAHAVLRGERAVVLDAFGWFDHGRLARATQARQGVIPTLLSAVRVSRADGADGWLELLGRDAEVDARRTAARWVFVFGLLDPFRDAVLPPSDAWWGATRAAASLHHLSSLGFGVVAAQDRGPLAAAGRSDLLQPVLRRGGRVIEVAPASGAFHEDRPVSKVPDADVQLSLTF